MTVCLCLCVYVYVFLCASMNLCVCVFFVTYNDSSIVTGPGRVQLRVRLVAWRSDVYVVCVYENAKGQAAIGAGVVGR